jgi:RNA polymerase sigma factor (sigma-70 family)
MCGGGFERHCASGDTTVSPVDLCTQLQEVIPMLPPRERMVIELLLEGKSQAVISHMIGVCEGTASRLRSRATAKLRALMTE